MLFFFCTSSADSANVENPQKNSFGHRFDRYPNDRYSVEDFQGTLSSARQRWNISACDAELQSAGPQCSMEDEYDDTLPDLSTFSDCATQKKTGTLTAKGKSCIRRSTAGKSQRAQNIKDCYPAAEGRNVTEGGDDDVEEFEREQFDFEDMAANVLVMRPDSPLQSRVLSEQRGNNTGGVNTIGSKCFESKSVSRPGGEKREGEMLRGRTELVKMSAVRENLNPSCENGLIPANLKQQAE